MVLIEGAYCPDAVYVCKRWLDPPGRFHNFRCAEYAPSVCASKERKHLRFCIDRDEFTKANETLPEVNLSWTTAGKTCVDMGKRLCLESEWQFACEGEEMRPYPYGFVRDTQACNIDRQEITGKTAPIDLREPAGSHPRCVSPFGVRDMSGNIEEWATIDGATLKGQRSTMKGAWWLPGRNHCRARTLGHGEIYYGPQIGVRCCTDAH
jgi:formylglycine-generating enzyme required for sulfatase activity